MGTLTPAAEKLLRLQQGKMLPLTKRQRTALVKTLYSQIYRTMSDARIESMSESDSALNRLYRIEAFAFSAMVNIVEGL
jgi:hypothetical protein